MMYKILYALQVFMQQRNNIYNAVISTVPDTFTLPVCIEINFQILTVQVVESAEATICINLFCGRVNASMLRQAQQPQAQ